MLSKRALLLRPSPTLAMAARARELQAEGKDVVSLTVGEPDWNSFAVASRAGIEAIEKNFTKYTAAQGMPELRTAIAEDTKKHLGVSYALNEVCVSSGAKFVIFAALQMLCDAGDEVLIPSPYWVSYPVMAELAGAQVKVIDCGEKENFKLSAEALSKSLTSRSKVLILCSPSNPTGLVYTKQELAALADVIESHPHLFVISDDIYNRLLFSGETVAPHLLHVRPELKSRVFVVNGASKTYSMTGWRIGWGLGPQKLVAAISDYLSQSTSSPSSISQKAVLAALQLGEPELKKAQAELKSRKDYFLSALNQIPGFQVAEPQGAFYFWVRISDFFGHAELQNSKDVAELLLSKYHVATVPGIEFGCESYLRLSYATSKVQLEKAAQRFTQFSKDLFNRS